MAVKEQKVQDDNGGEDRQEERKDLRWALKSAFKEHAEKDEKDKEEELVEEVEEEKEEKKGINKKEKLEKEEEDEDEDEDEDEQDKEEQDKEELKSKGEKQDTSNKESEVQSIDPPPFWKNKGKSVWDKLSSEDKQVIASREKEVSDGFAQISPRLQLLGEIEQVIAPRAESIQRFGVSPVQTIDRLFQWMEALSNPDQNVKVNSFKQLAQNFGIEPSQLINESQSEDSTNQFDASKIQPFIQQSVAPVSQELEAIKAQLANQQQAAASAAVNNWANGKTYFPQVRELMHQLIVGGAVPLKDGQIDLDGAYEKALKIHPDVSMLVQKEAEEKTKVEAAAKAAKDAKEASAKIARARRAGSSLKPAAPSLGIASVPNKANGTNKSVSVRESLEKTFEELRDN